MKFFLYLSSAPLILSIRLLLFLIPVSFVCYLFLHHYEVSKRELGLCVRRSYLLYCYFLYLNVYLLFMVLLYPRIVFLSIQFLKIF